MSKKIKTEIALILTLLAAVIAVAVIFTFIDRAKPAAKKSVEFVSQSNGEIISQPTVYEQTYSFKNYGLNLLFSIDENIVGNDYGDGLVQFVIKERTDKNGEIAYDGGYPIVGIKVSDSCLTEDTTLMCSHFDQLTSQTKFGKWKVRQNESGEPVSVQRANLDAAEEDFYDEYYVKINNRVVSVYFSQIANPVYVLEGVDKKALPKLPALGVEQKRMKDFMLSLIEQLEEVK